MTEIRSYEEVKKVLKVFPKFSGVGYTVALQIFKAIQIADRQNKEGNF